GRISDSAADTAASCDRRRADWDWRVASLRVVTSSAALIPFAEYHFAGSRLQNGSDRYVDGLADHLARIVDYHHGSVVEIGDALVVFLAFLEDEDAHDFAGQHDGLQRIGE